MGEVLHGSARTTAAIRRAIQHSPESLQSLGTRFGINPNTVAKWRKRPTVQAARMGPEPASRVLSAEQEALAVAFRRHTLLALADCLYALQATIPHLSRSALPRCFQRHGSRRLPLNEDGQSPPKKKCKDYPIGYRHVDFAEGQTEKGASTSLGPSTAPVKSRLPSCIRGPNGSSRPSCCGACSTSCRTKRIPC